MANDFEDFDQQEEQSRRKGTQATQKNTVATDKNTQSKKKNAQSTKQQLQQQKALNAAQEGEILYLKILNSQLSKKNTKTLISAKNTRNLAGSLAVLRSEILIVAFGINQLNKTVGAAIQGWTDFENAQSRVGKVIESTGGAAGFTKEEVIGMAQEFNELTKISETVITSSSALLLTFTNIANQTFPDAQKAVLDMTVAMNHGKVTMEGLKSSTIQVGKALNDPIKGMNALSRVGVKFSQTQKNQVKQMMLFNDVAGAQKIVLDELNREFGGQSGVQDFEYHVRALNDAWSNLSKDVGGSLKGWVLPLIKNLARMAEAMDPRDIRDFTVAIGAAFFGLKLFNAHIAKTAAIVGWSGAIKVASFRLKVLWKGLAKANKGMMATNTLVRVLSSSLGLMGVALAVAGGVTYFANRMRANKDETKGFNEEAYLTAKNVKILDRDLSLLSESGLETSLKQTTDAFKKYKEGTSSASSGLKTHKKLVDAITLSGSFYTEAQAKSFNSLGIVNEEQTRWTMGATLSNQETLKSIVSMYNLTDVYDMFGGYSLPKVQAALAKLSESGNANTKVNAEGIKQYEDKIAAHEEMQKQFEKETDTMKVISEFQRDLIYKNKLSEQQTKFTTEANAGLREAMASGDTQAVKNIHTSLQYAKILKSIGLVAEDADGNMLGLAESYDQLGEGAKKLVEQLEKTNQALTDQMVAEETIRINREMWDELGSMAMDFAEEYLGVLQGIETEKLRMQQEAQMAVLDAQLAEINNSKKHEKFKERERKKVEKQKKALDKQHHNENVDMELKQLEQSLYMSIGSIWVNYAQSVISVIAKWALVDPTGGGMAAKENAANAAIAGASTAMAVAMYSKQKSALEGTKMQYGGLVGGNLHSQGGTMLEAERGEYVVSRQGVQNAGLDTLNKINRGQSASNVNISFSGNILSKDFIEDEAIPQIKEAVRRGADLGIG